MQSFTDIWNEKNIWIASVFSIYLFVVFIFAALYYGKYNSDRSVFAFNADILRMQHHNAAPEIRKQSAEQSTVLSRDLEILRKVQGELAVLTQDPTPLVIADDYDEIRIGAKFSLSKKQDVAGPLEWGIAIFPLQLKWTDEGEKEVILLEHSFFGWCHELAALRELFSKWTAELEAKLNVIADKIASLDTDRPAIWNFWDFLYFSAITQFTVDYGDILPNHTSVRLLVVIQTFISAALLVVFLNLVFH